MKENITACIDGSAISSSVCDSAAWASSVLKAPIQFLHVLERPLAPAREDFSGAIGLGSREHLLDELVELDEKRGKLAIEHGKHMLADAKLRAETLGAREVSTKQRHGPLLDTLLEYEEATRVFVMGRLGEGHQTQTNHVGSHLESVVRMVQTPVIVAIGEFQVPDSFLMAYDGSETANNAIKRIAHSPLLVGLQGHVVMVGSSNDDNQARLSQAVSLLEGQGHKVSAHLLQGDVAGVLETYREQHNVKLKVMGAYGHSRIREFFLGSTTSHMIATSPVPILLMR